MKLPDALVKVTPLSKYLAMFFFIFFPFLAFWGGMAYQKLIKQNDTITTKPVETNIGQEFSKEKQIEQDKKVMLDDFVTYYLPQYPNFQSKFKPDSILQVYLLGDRNYIDHDDNNRWLVEVQKDTNIISHYLLTPEIEKELIDSMSCVSQDINPPIKLDKVQVIGNERNLGRKLEETSGYLVLSGTKNECYGGANTGFVSVYNARTGDKIKLQGDFNTGKIGKGVSGTGNALGILKGVYGLLQPQIVIEYGNYDSAGSLVEQVDIVAYFDLQTGNLKQLIKFK